MQFEADQLLVSELTRQVKYY